ncbi:CBR-SET-14 protein [Teratosphaeria destructans]|uniref:CBR-SET-14 protein n=1 Tax=Teratosphaeria destructans TaxID=418781 RepID=A0A9W7W5H8_9PEZI|nr:CBR-SET-14 protein [Teratosphaeria destructans]
MEGLVPSFNALPRSRTTPTGLPNHWVFRIGHVPLHPPGDMIILVHPQSRYLITAGPAQLLSLQTTTEKAEAIAPLLLKAFLNGGMNPMTSQREHPARSPWSWSTEDAGLATALAQKLRESGVEPELCSVGVCSTEDKAILAESWSGRLGQLQGMVGNGTRRHQEDRAAAPAQPGVAPGDPSRCHHCNKTDGRPAQPLKTCRGCSTAWYCGRECQKKHWKRHRPSCHAHQAAPSGSAPPPGAGSNARAGGRDDDAFSYYNSRAHTTEEAQALARSVNLTLPRGSGTEGILKPVSTVSPYPSYSDAHHIHQVRRLVTTGKDTPENFRLLFGPDWERELEPVHEEARMEVLLDPPRGSPAYAMNAGLGVDDGAPAWSPRPASEVEQQKIADVREMQAVVREKVGVGSVAGASAHA